MLDTQGVADEAAEIQELITSGRARDVQEAEAVQLLGDTPGNIVREFLSKPPPIAHSKRIEQRVHTLLQACFAGARANFLFRLCKTSAMDQRLLAAIWLYELDQRGKLVDKPYDNRSILFSKTVQLASHSDLLGRAVKNYLKHLSLKELVTALPASEINYAAIPYFSEHALANRDLEPESARQVLVEVIDNFTARSPYGEEIEFFRYAYKFSPTIINEILDYLRQRNPALYGIFCLHLGRAALKLNQPNARHARIFAMFFETSPVFRQSVEHGKAIAQTELRAKQEALERDKANAEAAQLIARLSTCQVSPKFKTATGRNMLVTSRTDMEDRFSICVPDPFGEEDDPECFRKDMVTVQQLLASPLVSQERGQELQRILAETRARIRREADQMLQQEKIPELLDAVRNRFSFNADAPSDELASHLQYVTAARESFTSSLITATDSDNEILRNASDKILTIMRYVEIACRTQYEVRRGQIIEETKREYLLEQIRNQIDYLRNLYGASLGLGLPAVEGAGVDHDSGIGSVSVGLSLSPRLIHRPELNVHLLPEEGISIEVGGDLESIQRNIRMVNWVAAHEIAHLAEDKKQLVDPLITSHGELINHIADETPEEQGEELKKTLIYTLRESAIDGIGYGMLCEYGTVDPSEATREERVNAAALSFASTMDLLCRKMRGKFSNHSPIILLRMLANVDMFLEELLQQDTIRKLVEAQQRLEGLYEELNEETWQLSLSQQHEIIKLCREIFKEAESRATPN